MTKTERNKSINKLVYRFAEKLGYEVDMTEIDVMFISPDGNMDNDIQYRRSTQDVYDANWSSEKTKSDVEELEQYIKILNTLSDEKLEGLVNMVEFYG
jgi:hypothetical protein